MAVTVKVYDYDTAALLEKRTTSTHAEIRYTGRNDLVNIEEDLDDGDAYLSVNDFGWWIGCQHAIRLVWGNGEEVILKPDSDIKIRHDKKRMAEILDYLRKLIDNKFEYMPFGEPGFKLELSGAETEFMDI